jgi:hypothetical protein
MIHGWCRAGVVIDEDATSSFLHLRRFRIRGLVLSIPSFHAFLQPSAASLALLGLKPRSSTLSCGLVSPLPFCILAAGSLYPILFLLTATCSDYKPPRTTHTRQKPTVPFAFPGPIHSAVFFVESRSRN